MKFIIRIISHKHIWRLLLLLLIDGLLFGGTNARNVVSYVVVIGFILLAATLYYVLYGLLTVIKLYGIPVKHKRRLAVSLTGLTSGLVALQSIGELSPRDVLIIVPLSALIYLYSFYSVSAQERHLS